jgi:hypothetical protein
VGLRWVFVEYGVDLPSARRGRAADGWRVCLRGGRVSVEAERDLHTRRSVTVCIICGGMDLQNVVQLPAGITCRQTFKLLTV